ncbi:hypothetical protein [Mycobacterium asiaticum]|uniref:hypothetical protein n=1 Tax=Mycobacterium asiaticum TaxID=1790 RepID=UPI0012DAF8FA|nr:hypothetical protein [Mycobacterium asiaticum]
MQEFKGGLIRVLSGQVVSPVCMAFGINVTLALLNVAHAVRQGRPTHDLIMRACGEFSSYASGVGASDIPSTLHTTPVIEPVMNRATTREPGRSITPLSDALPAEIEYS